MIFSDPNSAVILGFKDKNELNFNGVYRFKKGEIELITDKISFPNGLDFSPNFNKLYISDTDTSIIYSLDVSKSDEFTNLREFIDQEKIFADRNLTKNGYFKGSVGGDGLKTDKDGNIFVTTNLDVVVYDKDGNYLGEIALDSTPTNLAFGGDDLKTLYITAMENIYEIMVLTGK